MHFPIKVVRQPSIIIQPTQIRSAHITDLQLLMSTRSRRIAQCLQLSLLITLRLHRLPNPKELLICPTNLTLLTQHLNLQQPRLNTLAQIANLLQQRIRLSYFIRRLLQSPLRHINSPIAFIDVFLQIAHVVVFEAPFLLVGGRGGFEFCFEGLGMDFGTGTEILFSVCKEVVGTGACEEGAAYFGVGDGELGCS